MIIVYKNNNTIDILIIQKEFTGEKTWDNTEKIREFASDDIPDFRFISNESLEKNFKSIFDNDEENITSFYKNDMNNMNNSCDRSIFSSECFDSFFSI